MGYDMEGKEIVWLHGEVKTPPFSSEARVEAGSYLRQLQQGESLSLPHSRPMPTMGARCHELRIQDRDVKWRIMYRVDEDAIIVADVFPKKTPKTPLDVINNCKKRFTLYDKS